MAEARTRPAWAEVDLDAVRHNVGLLRGIVAPSALCAVVKAGGYGHGAVPVARAAVEAGATWLAAALVDEGVELREAGITEPVLLLSEPPADAAGVVVSAGLTPTVATIETVQVLAAAARAAGTRLPVHLKVDTGMHRVGVPPQQAAHLAAAIEAEPALVLQGLFTHLAVADGTNAEDRAFTALQLERFDKAVAGLDRMPSLLHTANTAGALAWPGARRSMVRCGIGVYGLAPAPGFATGSSDAAGVVAALRPALSLKARVTAVRELDAGERPSYGRRRPLPGRSTVATVPLGYADGVPRALFEAGCSVLVGGRRMPLAGSVTMDQLMVDCGPSEVAGGVAGGVAVGVAGGAAGGAAYGVAPGDEVVLIGRQDGEEVTVSEWAAMLGTIDYEVVCAVGPRVPRRYLGERTGAEGATT